MSDVGDSNFVRYIYRGEANEGIPEDATHITVHKDAKVIRQYAFWDHLNIIEVVCHENVGMVYSMSAKP